METVYCPYCNSVKTNLVLKSKDFFLSQESFQIHKCADCKISFTYPIPSDKNITNYYQSDSYVSHGQSKSILDWVYVLARKYTLRWKLKIIQSLKTNRNLLDVGCGTGDFLTICKIHGLLVDGIEPSAKARAQAELQIENKIYEDHDQLEGKLYDVITMWHVLEHVTYLKVILQKLKEKIASNGYILIAVPNHLSYDAKYYKEYWAAYDLPRHLWHFDIESMTRVLNDAGLQIQEIIPMKLDAYYISLISNSYKESNVFYRFINSLLIGLKSNFKARRNNNYSSILFIVKKK